MSYSIKFVLGLLAALVAIQLLSELLMVAAIGLTVLAIYYHGVYTGRQRQKERY